MSKENWYWLASGLGWGAVNSGELLDAYPGGADEIFAELGSEKLDEMLTQKQADRLGATHPQDFALKVHAAQNSGLAILTMQNEEYPSALRAIHNPPMLLFVKGDTRLLNGQLSIGMVGARRPSAYGVEVAKALGRGIALGGAIIISGLAAGLDAEAHKAALAVNGPTIACIAFGHGHCYPAANKKLMEVIERYGAVVSEYPPDTSPEKPFFLQRNRLIAGLSHGLVVIEARRHSGTMSTVNFAVDFAREVFAVPGSIFSELSGGTNAMIQEGAYVAAAAGDILGVYGIELKGEDPVATAAKQAAQGRPAPATAAPPWQQSIRRFERSRTAPGEETPLPGQQSLGEMLRRQLGEGTGEVSAAQAVSAFRALQQKMPAATGSELDARNRALDEMVEAVSDNVQISGAARRAGGREVPPDSGGAKPFPWHKVERLDKAAVEDLSPAGGRGTKKPAKPLGQPAAVSVPIKLSAPEEDDVSLASTLMPAAFLRRLGKKDAAPAGAPPARGAAAAPQPSTQPGPIEAVGRVRAVQRPAPASTIPEVQPEAAGIPVPAPPAPPPPPTKEDVLPKESFVPKPVAERPIEKPRADSALSGRLRTLQTTAPEKQKPARMDNFARSAHGARPAAPPAPPDPGTTPQSLLSDDAKKALAQLGPRPATLADICKRSGLSSAGAMAALTELELAGLSRQLPGRQFVTV